MNRIIPNTPRWIDSNENDIQHFLTHMEVCFSQGNRDLISEFWDILHTKHWFSYDPRMITQLINKIRMSNNKQQVKTFAIDLLSNLIEDVDEKKENPEYEEESWMYSNDYEDDDQDEE